jgi:hypothetical protein
MAAETFSLLRTTLRTIGLSDEVIEDEDFPYALRDDFLSAAEQSFARCSEP